VSMLCPFRFNWMWSTNVIKREGELLDDGIVDTLGSVRDERVHTSVSTNAGQDVSPARAALGEACQQMHATHATGIDFGRTSGRATSGSCSRYSRRVSPRTDTKV
jgi:hypothetical protein